MAGDPYDKNNPDDGSGMAPRSCTDVFCTLLFFAFLGCMGYVVNYGVTNGQPQRLTHGFNYNGELCGVDPAVKSRPLLYWCPTMSAVPGIPTGLNLKAPVCVDHCPVNDNETMTCMQQTQAAVQESGTVEDPGQTVVMAQSTVQIQSYATNEVMGLYCIPDLKKLNAIATASGVPVPGGLRDSLFNSAGPIGKNSVKAQQYIGSLRRCSSLLGGSLLIAVFLGYGYLFALKMCAKPLIYITLAFIVLSCFAVSGFFIIGEMMPRPSALNEGNPAAAPLSVTAGATTAAPPVAPAAATGPTAAPFAPVATGPTAAPVVTGPTAAPVILAPPVIPARRMMTYEEACQRAPESCAELDARWNKFGGRKSWEEMNPFYSEHLTLENAKHASMVTSGVFAVIGLIFVILICCAARAINTATGCVEAACDALFSMPCMLLMPAIEMLIKAILMCVLLVFLAYLVSAGTMDTKTYASIGGQEVNGLRRHFKYTDEQKGYIAFYIFGMIWLLELCNALGSFVISYAVVGWYYTPKGQGGSKGHNWCGLIWGYVYGLTFHLGSLAFGSLLIAILRYVRLILSVLEKESKAEGNVVMACIAKILICCITCFKKFVEMINKNAYIDICITSNSFCAAASDVMQFFVGHPAEIVILNGACLVFSFAGMAFISGTTSVCTYMLCTTQPRWTDESSPNHVASPGFVALVAGLGALFVAHAFMQIFDHTADTLLYTYCWNKSKAHNTVEKYAPDSLARLAGYTPLERPKPGKAAGGGHEEEKKKDCSIQ